MSLLFDKINDIHLTNNILFLYTFSKSHKEYIYTKYPTFKHKILSIYRPIEFNNKKVFNITHFLKNKKIYHLDRNFQTFIDCTFPEGFHKCMLLIKENDLLQWNNTIVTNNNLKNIEIVHDLSHTEYSTLFQHSCVFADMVDCKINNTILECISCNTPIILTRTPSAEEYLGKDYPLFFNSLEDLRVFKEEGYLLNLIISAHSYLQNVNKTHITIDTFNNKINYDLSKLTIHSSNIQLSWCCLVTLENKSHLNNFIDFFIKQDSNKIYLFLFIEHDLKEIIYDIEDIMITRNNIEYIFLEKNHNIYAEFYNQCIQTVTSDFLTIVNINNEFNVDFSSLFIDYLNTYPTCDIAFSSFQYINDKKKDIIVKSFEKDLLLFESNFYSVELPNTGVVWRKKIHHFIYPFDSIFYFLKKCMNAHLNIMCISENPIYSILC